MIRRAWRLPMLLLLPALLIAAVVVQRGDSGTEATTRADRLAPVAPDESATGSTWYCAAGSATGTTTGEGAGLAEHVVSVANLSDEAVTGRLSVIPAEGEPAVRPIELAAGTRTDIALADVLRAQWASAVVELDGSRVAVEHELRGAGGRSVSPCASHPSPVWYFPAGTTRAGTTTLLSLFNPFPGEASVDLSFETEDGTRTPQQFQGLIVPGGRVTVVDVGAVVTLRDQLATTVQARNGRIIAEQLMVSAGTDGAPQGLTAVLGAPAAATDWVFPDTVGPEAGRSLTMAVLNPGDTEAEVEVQVFLDDPAVNGTAEPFTVTVPPKRYASVDVFADGRVPQGVGSWMQVRSLNGVGVVAERLEGGSGEAAVPGFAATLGSPVVATEWYAPVASVDEGRSSQLVVVNPAASGEATVTVTGVASGATRELPGVGTLVIPAGSRVVVPLGPDGLGLGTLSVLVESDRPVVASMTFGFSEDFSSSVAVAVGTVAGRPSDPARPDAFLAESPVPEPEAFDAPLTGDGGIDPTTSAPTDTAGGG
jgi:hypothetical protein